jgi:hypothetical protein
VYSKDPSQDGAAPTAQFWLIVVVELLLLLWCAPRVHYVRHSQYARMRKNEGEALGRENGGHLLLALPARGEVSGLAGVSIPYPWGAISCLHLLTTDAARLVGAGTV